MRTKKRLFILLMLFLILILVIPGFNNTLAVRHYTVESDKITNPVCIALVTDLHSCKYGSDERELIDAVEKQSPDIIMMAGDIFDDVLSDDNTECFIKGISGRYPCYYVTGNHEYRDGKDAFERKMEILNKYNVKTLSNTAEVITINGQRLNVCGVDDPDSYMLLSDTQSNSYVSFNNALLHSKESIEK